MEKIQEILNKGLEKYIEKNKVIGYKQKVIKAIKDCKTEKMGGHKYVCDECGYEEIAYNSCRNRHCPNCQIRYYGILGNRNKKKKLLKCKILTRTKINIKKKLPTLELLKQTLGKDFNLCPHCKKGHMLIPNTT